MGRVWGGKGWGQWGGGRGALTHLCLEVRVPFLLNKKLNVMGNS